MDVPVSLSPQDADTARRLLSILREHDIDVDEVVAVKVVRQLAGSEP